MGPGVGAGIPGVGAGIPGPSHDTTLPADWLDHLPAITCRSQSAGHSTDGLEYLT